MYGVSRMVIFRSRSDETVRVAPGAPDQSELIRKMTGTTCGDRMPRAEPTYFDANPGLVVRVRSWILAGALND